MNMQQWWHQIKKMQGVIENIDSISSSFSTLLSSFQPLLKLSKAPTNTLAQSKKDELVAIIKNLQALNLIIKDKEVKEEQPQNKVIYELFSKIVERFLQQLKLSMTPRAATSQTSPKLNTKRENALAIKQEFLPTAIAPSEEEKVNRFEETNSISVKLFKLHKDYSAIMEARKEKSKLHSKAADELDRLNCFMKVVGHWMEIRCGFEHIIQVLSENIKNTDLYVDKKPLPLQFRIEKNPHSGTYRFIKASPKTSTSNDQTVFDMLDETLKLKILKRGKHLLVDHSDIIRFIRLHSVKNNLLQFKEDALSEVASRMYQLFSTMAVELQTLSKRTIRLINQTPMNELEYAFFGVNPEDCKVLLRYKFQSLLPGVNEDHYYLQKEGKKRSRKERTRDTMDSYKKKFIASSNDILSNVKSTMAMSFWVRKLLTIVLKNDKQKKVDAEHPPKIPYLDVGISNTIGDEDIMNFYINPDDIISSEGVLQRADRADKWLMVNKSEKLHHISKKDFFSIINTFIQADLNVALKKFGLKPIDFKDDLLPEIEERLSDIERIDIIRSGILGTGITTLEDYCTNTLFHKTFNTYFNEKKTAYTNYPYKEKVRNIAEGLVQSKTAILQMKYRKILSVQNDLLKRIEDLKSVLKGGGESLELKQQYQLNKKLNDILERIKMIMELSKPSLKKVQLETGDMVVHQS